MRNVKYAKGVLVKNGIPVPATQAPILSILPETEQKAERLKEKLISKGIFPSYIRYPGGPENGYFRFAISSEHTRAQIEALLSALTWSCQESFPEK